MRLNLDSCRVCDVDASESLTNTNPRRYYVSQRTKVKPNLIEKVFGGRLLMFSNDSEAVSLSDLERPRSDLQETIKRFGAHRLYLAEGSDHDEIRFPIPIVARCGFRSASNGDRQPFVFRARSHAVALKHCSESAAMFTSRDPIVVFSFPSGCTAIARCSDQAIERKCRYQVGRREITYGGIIQGTISSVCRGRCADTRVLVTLATDEQFWKIAEKCRGYRIPRQNIFRLQSHGDGSKPTLVVMKR